MRKHYLDNIRWATVLLVIIYHVVYLYNTVGIPFPVAKDAGIRGFDTLGYIVYPWFMALLFVVAGMSARYALNNKTHKQFLKSKVDKLLVPSTLGLFVFQWMVGYFNLKIGGALENIPAFIRYPIFVLSGIGPLWFIQMLFIFSLFIVLIHRLDKNDKVWNFCGKANTAVIILLGIVVWASSFILNTPVIETYRFGIYGVCYLIGYFVFSHDEAEMRIEKIHIPTLTAALILGTVLTVLNFGKSFASSAFLTNILTNVYLWAAILAIIGCSKAWFDKTSRFAGYMTKSSFGFYIVHYIIVLTVCYSLYTYTSLPHALNYILAWIIIIPLTALLYELLKRIPVIRYLVLGITAFSKKKTNVNKEAVTLR